MWRSRQVRVGSSTTRVQVHAKGGDARDFGTGLDRREPIQAAGLKFRAQAMSSTGYLISLPGVQGIFDTGQITLTPNPELRPVLTYSQEQLALRIQHLKAQAAEGRSLGNRAARDTKIPAWSRSNAGEEASVTEISKSLVCKLQTSATSSLPARVNLVA